MLRIVSCIAAWACDSTWVHAQERPTEFQAVGSARGAPPANNDFDDASLAASRVEVWDLRRPALSVGEVLSEVSGTRAYATGALGQNITFALRGAGREHTAVFLDWMPLSSSDGGAFDLSTLPAASFDAVEIYRGGAPAILGVSPIGGVVRLIPRRARGKHLRIAGGGGSFGTGYGSILSEVGNENLEFTVFANYLHTQGNYLYRDDNRTATNPNDDRDRERQNGVATEANLAAHLRARLQSLRIAAFSSLFSRNNGWLAHPSREDQATDENPARRQVLRSVTSLALRHIEGNESDPREHLGLVLGYIFENRRSSDPSAQFGLLPSFASQEFNRLSASFFASHKWTDSLVLQGSANYAYERFGSVGASFRDISTERHIASGGLEAVLKPSISVFQANDFLPELRASFRLEGIAAANTSSSSLAAPSTLAPTGRLGLSLPFASWFSVQGSGFSGLRAPSSTELFGDGGYLIANLGLKPETSYGLDAGFSMRTQADWLQMQLTVRGYYLWISNLIRYRPNNQFQAIAENIGGAENRGIELESTWRAKRWAELRMAGNFLDVRDTASGLLIPLRPEWTGYARFTIRAEQALPTTREGEAARLIPFQAFFDCELISDAFYDPANLVTIPGRARFGFGISATFRLASWSEIQGMVAMRDLFDQRGQDVLGFPLPGRTFYFEVSQRF